ncbi:MAG TPA: hypothetical protein VGR72_14280 [Candidatus Acidoferrales bacterium]|nr:hypothetical protein [Candidatus Acidoferrales bacterium]
MRFGPLALLAIIFAFVSLPIGGQQATTKDPLAISLLQKSVAAMAIVAPTDSSATGSINIVEGSSNETGTIQILTLGTNQTAENITLPNTQRSVVYSNGLAKEVDGTLSTNAVMELSVADLCSDFPLPLLMDALNNSDEVFQYIGQETLSGESVQHVRIWNSFASNPRLQRIAPFSAKDIWLDSVSILPVKIAYNRRAGGGAVPSIPVEVFFSNYTNVNGVQYPFQINKSYNGTPWQTITIQSVAFNTGLTSSSFQVQ